MSDVTDIAKIEAPPEAPHFILHNLLSPLEDAFIGSNSEGGKNINIKEMRPFLQAAREGDEVAKWRILDPLYLQEQKSSIDEVRKARLRLNDEKHIKGVFLFVFDVNWLLDVYDMGLQVWIELPTVGDNGHVTPEWRIRLLDKEKLQVISNDDVLKIPDVREKLKELLKLDDQQLDKIKPELLSTIPIAQDFKEHLQLQIQKNVDGESEAKLIFKPIEKEKLT